jgi:hypothetical protein
MLLPTRSIEPFEDQEMPTIVSHNHDVEDDGLEYALGFLARKLGQNQNLGHYSYQTRTDHDYTSARYVHQLSLGGLTEPTEYLMVEGRKLNNAMKGLHPFGNFSFKKSIIKRSTAYLRQHTTLDDQVTIHFVKLFVKFRIKRLNRESKELAKKKLERGKKSKVAKKINKLTT